MSLRSNGWVDVSRVASYFGGGGHVRAAGCTMQGSVYDVLNNLTLHIEKQFKAGADCVIHGVINIYKERGFTSHDVVA